MQSAGVGPESVWKETLGFLEVCKLRLQELIVAGDYGMISDESLRRVLFVKTAVQEALSTEIDAPNDAEVKPSDDL